MKWANHKTGIFNGYITAANGATVEAVITETIIGEDAETYITRFIDSRHEWNVGDGSSYEIWCTVPVGLHKSRLIGWKYEQLSLF